MPPIEALRAWMPLFVDYIATKKIISVTYAKISTLSISFAL
jgi:hypothetical protein